MNGLYIHIPFCVRKCAYCDFYSLAGREESRIAYVDAVLKEATRYDGRAFQTLYLGGGTPSLLGPALLERLIHGLRTRLDLSELSEATIEMNPDSATPELMSAAFNAGIRRISIGVQSLSDAELEAVGRVHDSSRAIEAVRLAKGQGFESVSADLIAGFPGQTWDSLRASVEGLTGMGVDHLSLYCLSIEEGTPLAAALPTNLPSDDDQAELFQRARELLAQTGFVHYEISNFARPGHQCQHNLNYWRGGEYVGLGAAAASHVEGKRYRNRADLNAYLADPTGQTEYVERLDIKEKAAEEAMLRLRLLEEGLDMKALADKYSSEAVAGLMGRLDAMMGLGMLLRDGHSYKLHPARVLTSNPIFAEVLG
jgi:oxygen-independent coproporphyrinogen III oxidase